MPKLKYDVNDVEERSFELPTPGIHRAKVEEITQGESKAGNPMLTVKFKTDGGAFLWERIVLTKEAAWKMAELMVALGLPKKGELDTDRVSALRAVNLRIKHEEYNGSPVARVAAILPFVDAPAVPSAIVHDDLAWDDSQGAKQESPIVAEAYSAWSLDDLKEECQSRGLAATGPKSSIVKRLVESDLADPFAE